MLNLDSSKLMGPDTSAFKESGLIHRIYIPPEASTGRSVPVVVMVHGWGGDETVMWLFKQAIPAGVAMILPRALFGVDNGGYSWFMREQHELRPTPDSIEVALGKFEKFIKAVRYLYPVDPGRMMLMGFSQGAALCNVYTLAHSKSVIGVASMAGFIPEQSFQAERHSNALAGLPVFVAHGIRDEVIPLEEAQRTRDIYAQLGANVTYGEYQVAHKMSTQAIKDLKDWSAKCFTDRQ
jgi:phospholipase/carboxylesterase